jgi:hypothetical protein
MKRKRRRAGYTAYVEERRNTYKIPLQNTNERGHLVDLSIDKTKVK